MKAEDSRLMGDSTQISEGQAESIRQAQVEAASAAEEENASAAQSDLWIFRDGRKLAPGPEMVRDLARRMSSSRPQSLLDALIQAGELEAALADAKSPSAVAAQRLTDELAFAVCSGDGVGREAFRLIEQIHPPDLISVSPPEGFTYYALHPLDFARLSSRIPEEPGACALIGIRSIGTTLSAMCAAALRQAGRPVSRITVRPAGHPYSRQMDFSAQEIAWIYQQLIAQAQFLIVDEGPGRSGSTFLSVAESLTRTGVPNEKITILGSREPNPESLCANDAASRWKALRFTSTIPSVNTRFENCTYAGGGYWRQFLLPDGADWPESWTQMERLKFISPDGKNLFKFEGMGPRGAEVRERALVFAESGLSPKVTDTGDGFLEYEIKKGTVVCAGDLSLPMLEHMARYCAFRWSHFPARESAASELRQMLEFNVRQEFGVEIAVPEEAFATDTPILADGRMQPCEWIGADEKLLKTDAISHGDDHFFPGPCDIAWDVAGIAIEWNLDSPAREHLLIEFRGRTGKELSGHLPLYMLAYAVFRLGFCKMGISTVTGSAEEARLRSAYRHYRALAKQILNQVVASDSRMSRAA
jgi:hypothetical protein